MLEAGILEHVEAIFALHVASRYPIGTVTTKPGPILAGGGFFEAVISGKGGHAAIPHHTIDPILAASNIIVSLQHLISREADPLDSQVKCLSITLFHILESYLLKVIGHYVAGSYNWKNQRWFCIQCNS